MYILLYLTLVLLFLYGLLINYYDRSWKSIAEFDINAGGAAAPPLKISVIIPARNEAENITSCLQSIKDQTYPVLLFEVIVIDDYSTDDTAVIVKAFPMANLRLLSLSEYLKGQRVNAYKKKAIETGIAHSTGELIVTTDADCTVKRDWLATIAAFQAEHQAAFIAAPVRMKPGRGLLSIFQSLDFITLQGITGASVNSRFHNMCNGANLAYLKESFYKVDGFKGIDNIASGDDMLLMQKIAEAYPDSVFFLKSGSSVVTTEPARSCKEFLNQRIRWASKSGNYKDRRISAVLLLVYLVNLFLLAFFVAGFFQPVWFLFFLILTAVKTIMEISFTRRVARFFEASSLMIFFPVLQPLHMLYIVVAGWLGLFGSYQWKERKVN